MLKQLRMNTKIIMLIVVVFFIGMIVFDWGMDISGRRRGIQAGIIGEVNGVKIRYDNYDALVRNQRDTLGSNQPMTYQDTRQLHEDVWDYIVNNVLIEQEIEKRGITYTDKELVSFMLSNPPQMVYQIPAFSDNGSFSLTKYQNFIQDPANFKDPQGRQFLNYIEMESKRMLPRLKLQQSLENGLFVRESEVHDRWLREKEQRKMDWLYIPASRLGSYPGDVDTDALLAYYNEHREDYRREELRSLDVVFFPMAPTSTDSVDVMERANLLTERARSGEDFASLANEYSEDPGNTSPSGEQSGGDLGFFGRGRMTKVFEDVAFNLQQGQISDPFLSQFGIHIVRVDSLKYNDNKEIDQVKARHILLKIEPSVQTKDSVENRVRAFYESVTGGMDMSVLAQMDSLQVSRTPPFQKTTQYIPGVGVNIQLLLGRIFAAKKGEILPVYPDDDGNYVFRVAEIRPAGIGSIDEAMGRVSEDLKRQMRTDYAAGYIRKVADTLAGGMDLRYAVDAVQDTLIKVQVESGTVTRDYSISDLGRFNPLIARCFGLENVGENTGPVITDSGAGIAVLTGLIPADEAQYAAEKNEVRSRLEQERKNDMMARFIKNLRDNARIADHRYEILTGL